MHSVLRECNDGSLCIRSQRGPFLLSTDDVFGRRPNCASTVVAIVVTKICKVAGLQNLPPDTGDDVLPSVV